MEHLNRGSELETQAGDFISDDPRAKQLQILLQNQKRNKAPMAQSIILAKMDQGTFRRSSQVVAKKRIPRKKNASQISPPQPQIPQSPSPCLKEITLSLQNPSTLKQTSTGTIQQNSILLNHSNPLNLTLFKHFALQPTSHSQVKHTNSEQQKQAPQIIKEKKAPSIVPKHPIAQGDSKLPELVMNTLQFGSTMRHNIFPQRPSVFLSPPPLKQVKKVKQVSSHSVEATPTRRKEMAETELVIQDDPMPKQNIMRHSFLKQQQSVKPLLSPVLKCKESEQILPMIKSPQISTTRLLIKQPPQMLSEKFTQLILMQKRSRRNNQEVSQSVALNPLNSTIEQTVGKNQSWKQYLPPKKQQGIRKRPSQQEQEEIDQLYLNSLVSHKKRLVRNADSSPTGIDSERQSISLIDIPQEQITIEQQPKRMGISRPIQDEDQSACSEEDHIYSQLQLRPRVYHQPSSHKVTQPQKQMRQPGGFLNQTISQMNKTIRYSEKNPLTNRDLLANML
ncbi:hypothetical protein FGO68_gene15483 [Halteria grandinella]|uniref:Uncharacterized protein n=1 Tax=Halteria grandinella TaxID=5974 RepID=A0A8J8NSQ0_HALGN|nr:hypothetical protein FGO68_gene15483 [Halteria grandinella]